MFEHRKLVHLSRTLWQNYRAYNICKSINWSYWFCRFQMCLTLLCICYGSRVINVFARSLTFKIHPKVERGKSWNFERTLCQNNRAYDSCTNINRSHLLCRFQICLTLYCSFYGSRVINVFPKSLTRPAKCRPDPIFKWKGQAKLRLIIHRWYYRQSVGPIRSLNWNLEKTSKVVPTHS